MWQGLPTYYTHISSATFSALKESCAIDEHETSQDMREVNCLFALVISAGSTSKRFAAWVLSSFMVISLSSLPYNGTIV